MMKLVKRSRRASPPPKKCHILAAPVEIRTAIYEHIAPRSFLPYAPYHDYMGLFLSCKQISEELTQESLRLAPGILRATQERDPETVMNIRLLRPVNFSSLMHITIGIPRWALFSFEKQEEVFRALGPLSELHLSSLTIGIEDLRTEFDVYQMIIGLHGSDFEEYMEALDSLPAVSGGPIEQAKFYEVLTIYANIVEFATQLNCIVAPRLCFHDHDVENQWCLRTRINNPIRPSRCNVRKIVLRLKWLHDEDHRSGNPHDVYPFSNVRLRWSPTDEIRQLRRYGWYNMWTDEHGDRKYFSKKNPGQFIWIKEKKKKGRVMKAVQGLLKGFLWR
ncbi:uncharacterized protein K460DRAFT_357014 [Cucurbitaria berberidis CBS 394.84]|uniref:F-box domain-containing protein n=1 Tax=Cucurbitaria berberidis CBS 394.84 TaxID=1168544 RepID=A0A9P4GCB9_9PLEO|nr:uncharacterized protein K460DRAFT_357014 [Cucurbitaria berberidis CBS 394.84]KAF1843258.1 hypothetical protein K460DRAFT_357014 [Cucurbitaria berberidis CBS 394.84]